MFFQIRRKTNFSLLNFKFFQGGRTLKCPPRANEIFVVVIIVFEKQSKRNLVKFQNSRRSFSLKKFVRNNGGENMYNSLPRPINTKTLKF